MPQKILQWHPAFQAALQIELADDLEYLQFIKEYNLNEKPLEIDTLIIKQEPGIQIRKSIGLLFRQHNIVEYKGPKDYISINDYYHVIAYACLYQSNTEKVLAIDPDEITLTFVSNHFPAKLVRHLRKRFCAEVKQQSEGIHYVTGLMFPVQFVVTNKLPDSEYTWLSRLRYDLEIEKDIEPLAEAYKGKEKIPSYEAVMDIIIRANKERYEEGRQMCQALWELFADELEEKKREGLQEGKKEGLQEGKKEGLQEGKKEGLQEGKREGLQEGKREGLQKGITLSVLSLLQGKGTVPQALEETISAQTDEDKLFSWLGLAAKVESVEAFMSQVEI